MPRTSIVSLGMLLVIGAVLCALLTASPAAASEALPQWKVISVSTPTNLSEGGSGELVITATNVGDGPTDGSKIAIDDVLPAGLTALSIAGFDSYSGVVALNCSQADGLACEYKGRVDPGDTLSVFIDVHVGFGLPARIADDVTVSGGGAPTTSASSTLNVDASPASFGIVPGTSYATTSTLQAGAHPDFTTGFTMSTSAIGRPVETLKDVRFDFPRGLVGDTVGIPKCTMAQVGQESATEPEVCPSSSIVGVASVRLVVGEVVASIYAIEPAPGEPAAFAFKVSGFSVRLDASVLSNGDYGVRVTSANLPIAGATLSTSITVWGVPADHNGPGPDRNIMGRSFGGPAPGDVRMPLLTNPTQCATPLSALYSVASYGHAGAFIPSEPLPVGTPTGCGLLPFAVSEMSMLPDTLQAGAPAGYTFKLAIPQHNDPDALGTANVRNVLATLPMGTVISPSAAWGLKACSTAQFYGPNHGVSEPAPPGECPRESQIGTVQITAPALALPIAGQVYLAEPECDPCTPQDAQDGKMVRLFIQAVGEGESGVVVKLEGRGRLDQQTGQLSVRFDENPQLPFSELELTLGGGPRASLANPRACGPATTHLDITAWSSPLTSDLTPSDTFEVNQGCFSPQFNPSFVAGSTNIQAGEFSPFTLAFARQDPDQFLGALQLQMPPGLLGRLSSVTLCKEPQAQEGTCPPDSLIGHTQVLTGPGASPFLVSGGQVFLTEAYRGAPFGLSIVVPAKAGPYTLSGTTGKGTVVVRSRINVDPSDSHLTVTSDPLPTQLDGIPLQLKVVNVTIDRPGFTFNPTSCARMAINGTLSSAEGASSAESSPFQVTNCQSLPFKPQFKVSTSGRTSRAGGASLDAKVTYPSANAANIARVKVELPSQLPSRLTTLQKACTAATFQSNPANCPAASVVGIARTTTPVLPVALTGPVYFVSHGAAAFPDLTIVLQGDGVRVDLVGSTFISKTGITSTTFKTVPDVPISSFELYLPQGRYSALAANANLCKSKLVMPTEMIAQNGAALHQSTKIRVAGCPKAKALEHRHKARKAARRHRGTEGRSR